MRAKVHTKARAKARSAFKGSRGMYGRTTASGRRTGYAAPKIIQEIIQTIATPIEYNFKLMDDGKLLIYSSTGNYPHNHTVKLNDNGEVVDFYTHRAKEVPEYLVEQCKRILRATPLG